MKQSLKVKVLETTLLGRLSIQTEFLRKEMEAKLKEQNEKRDRERNAEDQRKLLEPQEEARKEELNEFMNQRVYEKCPKRGVFGEDR